jgi:hypothetical protein
MVRTNNQLHGEPSLVKEQADFSIFRCKSMALAKKALSSAYFYAEIHENSFKGMFL